jgi:hypothetical protein
VQLSAQGLYAMKIPPFMVTRRKSSRPSGASRATTPGYIVAHSESKN